MRFHLIVNLLRPSALSHLCGLLSRHNRGSPNQQVKPGVRQLGFCALSDPSPNARHPLA